MNIKRDYTKINVILEPESCEPYEDRPKLDTVEKAASLFHAIIGKEPREVCLAAYLAADFTLLGVRMLSAGNLIQCGAHPEILFGTALMMHAPRIIIGHNHPQSECKPSNADKSTFRKLRNIGGKLNIRLLDSLVVGADGFYSIEHDLHGAMPEVPDLPDPGDSKWLSYPDSKDYKEHDSRKQNNRGQGLLFPE